MTFAWSFLKKICTFIVVNKGKNGDLVQTLYKTSFQTTNNLAF
jgi:hypothetical protein